MKLFQRIKKLVKSYRFAVHYLYAKKDGKLAPKEQTVQKIQNMLRMIEEAENKLTKNDTIL